ncbi:MAG TPA: hypothetical protein PLN69_09710 [bacterium]|nr:hypothetical protein [bacterium]
MAEYTHQKPGEKIESIAGHYEIEKEERLRYKGREVLVVLGFAIIDKSCCGEGGCRFAQVPGYITSWKSKQDQDGFYISEVERINDETEKKDIHEEIDRIASYCQISFL